MSDQAVAALADVLARENAALAAMDMHGATALLAEKRAALAALEGAATGAREPALARLRQLAAENRVLLERAMAVQSRVIALLVHAVREQTRPPCAFYGRGGTPGIVPALPLSMSARA